MAFVLPENMPINLGCSDFVRTSCRPTISGYRDVIAPALGRGIYAMGQEQECRQHHARIKTSDHTGKTAKLSLIAALRRQKARVASD